MTEDRIDAALEYADKWSKKAVAPRSMNDHMQTLAAEVRRVREAAKLAEGGSDE